MHEIRIHPAQLGILADLQGERNQKEHAVSHLGVKQFYIRIRDYCKRRSLRGLGLEQ